MLLRLAMACFVLQASIGYGKQKHIKLAAYDLSPYVSQDRHEHGYLYELVTQAFSKKGYTYEMAFFPPKRAKRMVESGDMDALLPSYASPQGGKKLLFSQDIHGSQIGRIQLLDDVSSICKQKQATGFDLKKSAWSQKPSAAQGYPDALFGEEDGVIRSSSSIIVRLVDMLATGRICFAIADKLQVADVLVNRRPNLIGKLKFVAPSVAIKNFNLAVSKKKPNSQTILDDFNEGLRLLRESGEYEQILLRYGYQIRNPDKNTLNIATVLTPDMENMKELSLEFLQRHPGSKINWHIMDENLLRRTVLSSLALRDNLFDVIAIGNYDGPIYARNNWIELLAMPKDYDVDDLLTPIRKTLSYGDKLYALPFYGESSMTYYRKDLFEQASLKMPEQPSYLQIMEFAKKLHKPEQGIFGICLRGKAGWGVNMAIVASMVNVFGGKWFNDGGEPELKSKAWSDAVHFYIELLGKYGPPGADANGYAENLKLFAAGRCGMWIDATVAASYLLNPDLSTVSQSVAFSKAPIATQTKGSHWLWTWALAIPKASQNKTLATEFITWTTSKEYIKLIARKKGWLAVPPGTRKLVYESEPYKNLAPFASFVRGEIESALSEESLDQWGEHKRGNQFVSIPEFTALGTSVGINLSLVLKKRLSVEKALDLSQLEAKRIMRQPTK